MARGQRVEVLNGLGVANEYARVVRLDKPMLERTGEEWYVVKFEKNENGRGLCIHSEQLRAAVRSAAIATGRAFANKVFGL